MSCIYGPRQFGFEDQGWVAWFIIATLKNRKITIYGNGKQVRDLLYVYDLIRAFDLFVKSKRRCGVYNIGGGPRNTTSLLEFLSLLHKELGKSPKIRFSSWRTSDQKVYISDITKINKELRWQPTIDLGLGVKKCIDWAKTVKSIF